jgi:hypothetical protein
MDRLCGRCPPREEVMGLVKYGGFVVTTKSGGTIRKKVLVTEESLRLLALHLGIAEADLDKIPKEDISAIFIYQGEKPPPK